MTKLHQLEETVITIGLLASGLGFAMGVAGLVYVAVNVLNTTPPSFGTQGEWLYGGVAALMVAGFSASKGATFYARRRRSIAGQFEGRLAPRIHLNSDGLSIRLGSPNAESSPGTTKTWTWSSDNISAPAKTLRLTPEQVAAANVESERTTDWDAVCRTVAPEYAALDDFERVLYRQAMQAAVEETRSRR